MCDIESYTDQSCPELALNTTVPGVTASPASGPVFPYVSLSNAEIWHRDPLEKMRRRYRAWRVHIQRHTKFRPAERLAKVRDRLPDSEVDEDTASGDASVQLRRDIAGLLLKVSGVGRPGFEELMRLLGLRLQLVYQDHWTRFRHHLMLQGAESSILKTCSPTENISDGSVRQSSKSPNSFVKKSKTPSGP